MCNNKITSNYLNYNTHHAPWGGYCSFILGNESGGGFAVNDVRSPNADVYLGFKTGNSHTQVMPFCEVKENDFEEAFGIGKIGNEKWISKVHQIKDGEYTRKLTLSTDEWEYKGLKFTIYSPNPEVLNYDLLTLEEKKKLLAPGVLAEISYDNTNSNEETIVFFGMNQLSRLIGDFDENLFGGAGERIRGFACEKCNEIEEYIGMNAIASIVENTTHRYKLGNNIMVKFRVLPGERKSITIALGTYQEGYITSGIASKFAYTDYFVNLEEVLSFLLINKEYYKKLSRTRDEQLFNSNISNERKLLIAQAYHSYLASTQLMLMEDNRLFWNVNEGEYRMMNTLDLTIDHMFFELKYHPWTIRNTLDFFWEKYSYYDYVKDDAGNTYPGGISFCHDCGGGNNFAKPHSSIYEVDQAIGCFSYMTMEELLNYTIVLAIYSLKVESSDSYDSITTHLKECMKSIQNRDRNHDGVMDSDSTKALGHSEITTYDSLDHSLAQAKDNLYIAVKTWATFLCMEEFFKKTNHLQESEVCSSYVNLIEKTIEMQVDSSQVIPSIFNKTNTSSIIPAIEALIYPYVLGLFNEEKLRSNKLVLMLKNHFLQIMKPGICIEPNNGGWKLTSSNNNTWMSKIFICQHVAEKIFQIDLSLLSPDADSAHLQWQLCGCKQWCAVDQVNCQNGAPIGSRLYPRLVTSTLWLDN